MHQLSVPRLGGLVIACHSQQRWTPHVALEHRPSALLCYPPHCCHATPVRPRCVAPRCVDPVPDTSDLHGRNRSQGVERCQPVGVAIQSVQGTAQMPFSLLFFRAEASCWETCAAVAGICYENGSFGNFVVARA